MTREEAISVLRNNTDLGYGIVIENEEITNVKQALNMTIQSLTAISELSQSLKAVNRYDMDENVLIGFNMAVAIFNKCFGEESCALKNEQSEQNVGMCQQNVGEMSEQTDGDLISRDYVLSKFKEQCERCGKYKENNGVMCNCCALDDAIDYVEDAPNAEKTTLCTEKTTITDMDLISRTELLNKIWQKEYGKDYDGVNLLNIRHIDIIENMPSTEKTAEWIIKHKITNSGSFWEIKCSNCGIESDSIYRYCPYCGAKMKGESDGKTDIQS